MVVSVATVPFDTLSVTFTAKPLATGAAANAVSPSFGISGYGDVVNFAAGSLSGLVYLTCDAGFNTTTAKALIVLGGNSVN